MPTFDAELSKRLEREAREGFDALLESSYEGPDERACELALRLVKEGPKAAHVSASECHEISEAVLSAYSGEAAETTKWVRENLRVMADQLGAAHAEVARLFGVLRDARSQVLDWNNTTMFTLARANLAVTLDDALDSSKTSAAKEDDHVQR